VDLRPVEQGQQTIEFDRVLMVGGTDEPKVGTPVVEGAKVVGQLAGEVKGPKLDVIKFRRRKGYRVKIGHRQRYLRVTISDIQV